MRAMTRPISLNSRRATELEFSSTRAERLAWLPVFGVFCRFIVKQVVSAGLCTHIRAGGESVKGVLEVWRYKLCS